MTVTASVLLEAKDVEATQTTQYTSTSVTTLVDKCVAHNHTTSAATLSINVVASGGTAGTTNLQLKKTLQGGETYNCPEMVGQILADGDFLSALAGTATAINLRISGRVVS